MKAESCECKKKRKMAKEKNKKIFRTADLLVGVVVLGQHPDVPQAVHQVGQGLLHLLKVVGHHLKKII
jgi:hypothetical protein